MQVLFILLFIISLIVLISLQNTIQKMQKKIFILEKNYENLENKFNCISQKNFKSKENETVENKIKISEELKLQIQKDYENKKLEWEIKNTEHVKVEKEKPQIDYFSKVQNYQQKEATRLKRELKVIKTKSKENEKNVLLEFLLKGNPLIKIGGAVLFIGLSFLLKFAFANNLISIKSIIITIGIFAIGLVIFGLKKQEDKTFSLSIQGIGLGIFYLDIFASAKLFDMTSSFFALSLMLLTVMTTCILAIKQNSIYLVSSAIVGGFITPILLSTNSQNHILLFSYYSILNLAILIIAYKKSWRALNLIGFLFTFTISFIWGYLRYENSMFYDVEGFIIYFFLLYVLVGYLFAKKIELSAYIDSILVFGAPISFLVFQNFVSDFNEHLLTYSCLFAGLVYLALASWSKKYVKKPMLFDTYLILGVIFLSIIVALEFSNKISAWIYAFEASLALWINLKQKRLIARYLACGLSFYAIYLYIFNFSPFLVSDTSLFGFMLLGGSFFVNSYLYKIFSQNIIKNEQNFANLYLLFSLILWFGGAIYELGIIGKDFINYCSASVLAIFMLHKKLSWKSLEIAFISILPSLLILSLLFFTQNEPNLLKIAIYFLTFFAYFLSVYYLYYFDKTNENLKRKILMQTYLYFGIASYLIIGLLELGFFNNNFTIFYCVSSLAMFLLIKEFKLKDFENILNVLFFGLLFEIFVYTLNVEQNFAKIAMELFVFLTYFVCQNHLKKLKTDLFLVIGSWVLIFVLDYEFIYFFKNTKSINTLFSLAVLLPLISALSVYRGSFFMSIFKNDRNLFINGILLSITIWFVNSLFLNAAFESFAYIPLLNPIDFLEVICVLFLSIWLRELDFKMQNILKTISVISLVLFTIILARFAHAYLNSYWSFLSIWANQTFQTMLSISYTLIAFFAIIYADKKQKRDIWLAGALLLGFVILKLFFVELSNSGTISRVVSFIAVGALMLIIGYFAPIPPKKEEAS